MASRAPTGRTAPVRTRVEIPGGTTSATLSVGGRPVTLTNLTKLFWPERGITKGDLLGYYAAIAPVLIPHIRDRAMVMKRYPNGAAGEFFFMKRTPDPHPAWLRTCAITHGSGSVIDFPVIDDVAALLWVVNLGCIDLNPWYARCDDVNRPDCLWIDLDPGPGTSFAHVREAALLVRDGLAEDNLPSHAKTTGSHGIHVAVPLVRGPLQKTVWAYAKQFAQRLAAMAPGLLTAEYRIAKRPRGRVLVDYNQIAWGRTLASVYSVRPTPWATVSAPITWDEIAGGIDMREFAIGTMLERVRSVGDLWAGVVSTRGRVQLPESGPRSTRAQTNYRTPGGRLDS